MNRIEQLLLAFAVVMTVQIQVHAEEIKFQLEDRPVVQMVRGKVTQTKRNLEWGFPMSDEFLGDRAENGKGPPPIRLDFEWSKSNSPTWLPLKGEWYQVPPQQQGSAWNGFCIASS